MTAGPVAADLEPLIVRVAADLDRAALRQVAFGRQLQLDPGLREQIAGRRSEVLAALSGADAVYGVTTGMGALSGHRLSPAEQAAHQRGLLLARAVGGAPWLSEPEVRALLAVRLRTFLSGDAGVSAELCAALVRMLADRRVSAVPRTGVGSAGEIIPLAHAFAPLAGLGRELVGGVAQAGAAAIYELGPKEGISLLAGVPGATALALLRAAEARTVAGQLLAVAAGAIVAVGAPPDPYLAATARGDEVLGAVLARLRGLLGNGAAPRMLQAPVSFRVVGPVLAQVERALDRLEDAVDRALGGVGDSPAYLDGSFVGTAGFHGIDLAAQLDGAAQALAHAADIAAAQLHRLLDERVTGLHQQLATRPGPDAGLIVVHKRAVAATHALRRAAQPSVLGPIET
ncbi:MAG TPA: aromatic amino acid lyase, partial [Mycobacteriales bacterium]|nr:aromatic amino acid lyase [Mycobacteriales bacterium]